MGNLPPHLVYMGKPNEGDKGEINIQNKIKRPNQMWLSRDTMAGQDRCSPTAEEGGLASKVIPHLQGDENITLGETPELQVIIDSEARLVERTPQEKQGNDADDVNDDVTVPDHDEWGEEEEGGWVDLGQDATDCDEDGSKDVVLTNEEKEKKTRKRRNGNLWCKQLMLQ